MVGNKFVVFVGSDSYLTFAEPENMRAAQEALDEFGAGYVLQVEKLSDGGASELEQILEAVKGLEVEVVDGRGKRIK